MSNVFIMALPVALIAAFFNLIAFLAEKLGYTSTSLTIGYVGQMTGHMFPILLNIYLATYYSTLQRLPKAAAISCSLVAFLIVSQQWGLLSPVIPLPDNFALSLFSAYATCFIIARLNKFPLFKVRGEHSVVDHSVNIITLSIVTLATLLVICQIVATCFSYYIQPYILLPKLDPTSFTDGLIYEFIRGLLWSVGVNGHNVLHMYKTELFEISTANMADWKNFGTDLNIISTNFYDFFTGMGGSGNTISLVFCMLFFAKSKGYRLLAKTVLILSIFNINEPILFGVPIIFNPVMMIPFLLTPLLSFVLAYGATSMGYIAPLSEVHSWLMPPIVNGYFASGESWSVAVFQFILIVLGMVIYYPFFKIMDRHSVGLDLSSVINNRFFSSDSIEGSSKLTSFIPSMQLNISAQKEVEGLYRSGSFILYYQPQVDIHTGQVIAVEALIRHISDDGKLRSPSFLHAFGQLGLMPELDSWVVERAVSDIAKLPDSQHINLSINISADTMLKKGFVKSLKAAVKSSGLNYHQVEIEVTEELLIRDEKRIAEIINEIKELGILVALDDFGTGYSSLAYLSRFDFDKIKIDRSLVTNLNTERGKGLFEVVVQLGNITNADIVVEGIETEEELIFIRERGIQVVQGFYYHKPMPLAELLQNGIVFDNGDRLPSQA